jgi:formylglycine-generating enzyme
MMGTTEEEAQRLESEGLWDGRFVWKQPAQQVTISRGFYLGKFEITQTQWEGVMSTRPWSGKDFVQDDPNHPAANILFDELREFVQRLNTTAGEEIYRLPTEAEWEYACRAGTTTRWSFGDDEDLLDEYAWYNANTCDVGECYAHAVGTKQPNPWGLYDMHGNVREWMQDWFAPDYYSESPEVDPQGPASSDCPHELDPRGSVCKPRRGWAYFDLVQFQRSAARDWGRDGDRDFFVGGRLVRQSPRVPTAINPASWGQVKQEGR